MRRIVAVLLCALFVFSCSSMKNGERRVHKDISPYDFGLSRAKTGIERYEVLLRTHKAAIAAGVNVDYTGIKN